MQQEFLGINQTVEFTPYEDSFSTRICNSCGEEKNIQAYEITSISRTKVYRKRVCRICKSKVRIEERLLKKIYGVTRPLGTPCDNCGKSTEPLRLDHCHKTGKFRGWICHGCNIAIGSLGDDLESLKRAVAYLERAEQGLHRTEPI